MATIPKSSAPGGHGQAAANAEPALYGRLSGNRPAPTAGLPDPAGGEYPEIRNRLAVLLTYLLKWRYQPARRPASWHYTIVVLRRAVHEMLADDPDLEAYLKRIHRGAYLSARLAAAWETGLDERIFPTSCPFSIEQTIDAEFWPN